MENSDYSFNNRRIKTATPVDAFSLITSTFLLMGTVTSLGSISHSEAFWGAKWISPDPAFRTHSCTGKDD
jgi:hypothetical protein